MIRRIILLVAASVFCSCQKDRLTWNLKRNNAYDVNFNSPFKTLSCESLTNVTSFVYKISPSSTAAWRISSGYNENGFVLTEPCYGGYIEISASLDRASKITFWTKSYNPGFQNIQPQIEIDGIITKSSIIDGSTDGGNWMRIESELISIGLHAIKIHFTPISSYYQYYIDEIQFWGEP